MNGHIFHSIFFLLLLTFFHSWAHEIFLAGDYGSYNTCIWILPYKKISPLGKSILKNEIISLIFEIPISSVVFISSEV